MTVYPCQPRGNSDDNFSFTIFPQAEQNNVIIMNISLFVIVKTRNKSLNPKRLISEKANNIFVVAYAGSSLSNSNPL